jgi:putative flippase GtrA
MQAIRGTAANLRVASVRFFPLEARWLGWFGHGCEGRKLMVLAALGPLRQRDPPVRQNLFLLIFQATKFGLVGIVATIIHYTVLLLLTDVIAVVPPTIASGVGSLFGIASAYVGNRRWTFRQLERHTTVAARFLVAYCLTMCGHTVIMYLQIELLRLAYTPAFIVATSASTAVNFVLNRSFVFNHRRSLRVTLPVRSNVGVLR